MISPYAVTRRLREPALAQPEVPLGEQEAVAEEAVEQAHAGTLDVVAVARDQHLLDDVRVVDEERAAVAEAHRHEIAVLAGAAVVEAELIAVEVAQAAQEQAPLRARRQRHGLGDQGLGAHRRRAGAGRRAYRPSTRIRLDSAACWRMGIVFAYSAAYHCCARS
jgi:hypothetical protein